MPKALIVYTTRTGDTQRIAERIAEGIRFEGVEAEVADVSTIKKETDLNGYDGYVFGSPTYHGDMLQPMKTFLFLAEKADLEGKAGGAFGAFGWSGEAPDRIYRDHEKHLQDEHGRRPPAFEIHCPGRWNPNGPGLRPPDREKNNLFLKTYNKGPAFISPGTRPFFVPLCAYSCSYSFPSPC